jgi:beta-lactamase regulating signal transducer with metallopeptidase domain
MIEFWAAPGYWPVRVVLLGGLVLLLGRWLLAMTWQPARRAVIGMAAVAAALAVIPLSLLPGWLPVELDHTAQGVEIVSVARGTDSTPSAPASGGEEARGASDGIPGYALSERQPLHPNALPASEGQGVRASQAAKPLPEPNAEGSPEQPPAEMVVIQGAASEASASRDADGYGLYPWMVAVYAVIAAGLLLRLCLGHIGLARLWRRAQPAPVWLDKVFRNLATDSCSRASLRISTRVGGPVCFGILRPRILLPLKLNMTQDTLSIRSILIHELDHLRRSDPFAGWLLGLARAVYFVWPWLSGLRREVRLAQEFLSDSEAARKSGGATDYAELLIRLTRGRAAPLGAAGVRGSSSELYRRVTMLLRNTKPLEKRCPRRWALAFCGGLTAMVIAFAGVYVQPRDVVAAEPEKKEAEKQEDPTKPPPKPAPKEDPLKKAIEKLKKDVADDPEAAKQLEELLKALQRPAPPVPSAIGVAPLPEPPAPPIALPRLVPLPAPPPPIMDNFGPEFEKDLRQRQEQMRRQMEELMKNLGARPGPGFGAPFPGMPGYGRLGIRVEKPSDVLTSQLELPNGQGLVCADVPAESTAGKIGLKPNDILLEVAGKPVSSNVPDFVQALRDVKPDAAVDVVVLRKGKKETLKGVKLPEAKELPGLPGFEFPALVPGPFVPPPRPIGELPGLPGIEGRAVGVAVGPGETARVEQVNDAFTIFFSKDAIKLTITGSKEKGAEAKIDSVEVDDNGKTTKAESIEKLPKDYQEMAKRAMKAIK